MRCGDPPSSDVPMLDVAQIETAKRFASNERRGLRPPGAIIYDIGERSAPAWKPCSRALQVVRRDGLNHETATATAIGQFTGEISQLAGRAALATGRAGPRVGAKFAFDVPISARSWSDLRSSGRWCAFILRRVGLIQEGKARCWSVGRARRLPCGLHAGNGYPYTVLDASADEKVAPSWSAWHPAGGLAADGLPERDGAEAADGSRGRGLPRHHPASIRRACMTSPWSGRGSPVSPPRSTRASEGLSVLVLDQRAYGGQAGASARIENYLGFPTGISGRALAGRAFSQALKFGAEIAIPLEVARLDCGGPERRPDAPLLLHLTDGRAVRARTVVIASGARYRQPPIPIWRPLRGLASLIGRRRSRRSCARARRSRWSAAETRGKPSCSSPQGQASASGRAQGRLEATMSRYLIDRIAALPNVDLHVGKGWSRWRATRPRASRPRCFVIGPPAPPACCPLRHLFLFIGADPNAGYQNCAAVDDKGFVLTGLASDGGRSRRRRAALETSVPGVFAIGDVRAGSTKRVAAAVGEGAAGRGTDPHRARAAAGAGLRSARIRYRRASASRRIPSTRDAAGTNLPGLNPATACRA